MHLQLSSESRIWKYFWITPSGAKNPAEFSMLVWQLKKKKLTQLLIAPTLWNRTKNLHWSSFDVDSSCEDLPANEISCPPLNPYIHTCTFPWKLLLLCILCNICFCHMISDALQPSSTIKGAGSQGRKVKFGYKWKVKGT